MHVRIRVTTSRRSATVAALALLAVATAGAATAPSSTPPADAPAKAGAPPPASAFGTVPAKHSVDLSPDGRRLAWGELVGGAYTVVGYDLAAQNVFLRAPVGDRVKLRDVAWADDSTLLVTIGTTAEVPGDAQRTYEFERTMAVDTASGRSSLLLIDSGARAYNTSAQLLSLRAAQPRTVVMAAWDWSATNYRMQTGSRITNDRADSGWVPRVYSVDTRSGKGTSVETGTAYTVDWAVDRDGEVVARADWDAKSTTYRILARRGDAWHTVHESKDGRQLRLARLAPDADAVLAIGRGGTERSKLWRVPLDGSGARVLVEDPERDVEAFQYDRFDAVPVAVVLGGLDQPTRWIDPQAEAFHARVARAFPGKRVQLYGRSADRSRALAYVESPQSPPVYYLVDFAARKADIVGEAYPSLVDVPLGRVEATTYPARDGTPIPAYVTYPPGVEPRALPTVVLPHGGPEARDDAGFDWLAQFLATRGYAVLQPQFRGSTGFGGAWREAGYGQWGGLMQDDVTDGVRALVARGIADPKRICIVGSSYGGYVALAGATTTPELYACAVSISGVADLPAMLGYEKLQHGRDSDSVAYWTEHIGRSSDPVLAKRSPVRNAAAARAPVLLLHGESDTVVPIAQSEAMARALGAAGKSVTFVRLPGEDHWLSRGSTRTRVLEETERFLARHLAGPAP